MLHNQIENWKWNKYFITFPIHKYLIFNISVLLLPIVVVSTHHMVYDAVPMGKFGLVEIVLVWARDYDLVHDVRDRDVCVLMAKRKLKLNWKLKKKELLRKYVLVLPF